MNASARRIGWTLITGLACTAPLATTVAAPFAGGPSAASSQPNSAGQPRATGQATPPTAPLPPEPAATAAPTKAEGSRNNQAAASVQKQESSLFGGLSTLASKTLPSSWAAKKDTSASAVVTAKVEPRNESKAESKSETKSETKAGVKSAAKPQPQTKPEPQPARQPQGLLNVFASGFSFGRGSSSKADPDPAAQAAPEQAAQAPQRPKTTVQAARPANPPTNGRFDPPTFDPSVGLAGHFVSDADERLAQASAVEHQFAGSHFADGPRVAAMPRPVASPIPTDDEPMQSAVVTDEEVSLASWLSSYASGAAGGYGHTGRIGDRCCPKWEAQVDALFFWQGNLPSRPLYIDSATGATALDANQLQSKAAIAPRYSITYNRDECRAIEVNYFQLYGFTAQQQLGPAVDPAGNGPFTAAELVNPPYDQIAGAIVTSSAHIQSLEVNLRRTDGGMIEWISGFRWLEWGQQLGIGDVGVSGGSIDGGDIIGITTLNNLYGWQWGADMMLWNAGRWVRINGVAKAGVYYNHQAAQNTTYTDFFNPDVNVRDGEDTVSFVGETGLNASFALTNWLSWRAGYTFLWLGGVATPTGQLGLTDITTSTSAVNSNGSAYLHGVTTGLEARW